MSNQKTSGPHRRILARLCALALIAAMLLTGAYAGNGETAKLVSEPSVENSAATVERTVELEPTVENLKEPAHRKYINANEEGTYTLSLDVTGASAEWTEQTSKPLDIILLADTSGSMKNIVDGTKKARYQILQDAAKELADALLTEQNTALGNDQQIQLAFTRFSGGETGSAPSCLTSPQFTSDKSKFNAAVDKLSNRVNWWGDVLGAYGATEWDKGLSYANSLSSDRPNAQKIIIFLSDGEPNRKSGYQPTVYQEALKEGKKIIASGTDLYSVGIADSLMLWVQKGTTGSKTEEAKNPCPGNDYYRCMETFAVDVNGGNGGSDSKYYSANDVSNLSEIFKAIIQDITHQMTFQDLVITDELSEYADFVSSDPSQVRVTNNKGEALSPGEYTVVVSGKKIEIRFPNKLEAGETYTVSFDIKPTQKAYDDRADNLNHPNFTGLEGYPVTGDNGTDAEGNQTSSRKPGFYSNDRATLTYHVVTTTDGEDVVGEEATARDYAKPVIQVELSQIPVEKTWSDGEEKHAEDTISVFLYRDNDSGTYRTLTLNAGNKWAGSFSNLPSGHTYFIQEQMNDDLSNRYTSTVETKKVSLSLGDTNTGSEAQRFTITNTLKVASFTIQKVDVNTKNPLADARFELREAAVNGDTWSDQEHGKTYYPDGNKDFLTSSDGKATFNDIPFGNYLLYETKAPAGYKLPKDPVRVTVEAGMVTLMNVNGETIGTVTPPTEGESTSQPDVTIPNKEQDDLPVAGGMGAIWFPASGLALMSAAAVLYGKRRRKGEKE